MDGSGDGPGGDGHHYLSLIGLSACAEGGVIMIITRILAVYRTRPVMIVAEMEEGIILELSLAELAEVYELLPPLLWQELVGQYHVFRVR
jgi:hypothetical protein